MNPCLKILLIYNIYEENNNQVKFYWFNQFCTDFLIVRLHMQNQS